MGSCVTDLTAKLIETPATTPQSSYSHRQPLFTVGYFRGGSECLKRHTQIIPVDLYICPYAEAHLTLCLPVMTERGRAELYAVLSMLSFSTPISNALNSHQIQKRQILARSRRQRPHREQVKIDNKISSQKH